jgi:uncharacterized protein
MDLQDLERMTADYGEHWALPHVRRVLCLVSKIDQGIAYDHEALTYAVYLHDWGAFAHFRRAGVDHALRSRQVAESEILPQTNLNPAQKKIILEAIEYHDYRNVLQVWTQEAILLREADFLDFLGAIGVAREIAWDPAHLSKALERLVMRRDSIKGHFSIPAAQQIAQERLQRMDQVLAWIKEESFGEL